MYENRFKMIGQERPKVPEPTDPEYSVGQYREHEPRLPAEDPRYLDPVFRNCCGDYSHNWYCTRGIGHCGDHAAHIGNLQVARWPQG